MSIKKEKIGVCLSIAFLLIVVVGVSYAAFNYARTGDKVNTITTGVIVMGYEESSNVVSITNALPTTDETGKKSLKSGSYFDFTISSTIQGNATINFEIAAEDVSVSDKSFSGDNVKFYLSEVTGEEEKEIMTPRVYKEEKTENETTGRPSNMMSLAVGTVNSTITTNYRLRLYVDEKYNPQDDGGNLIFKVRINAYGKVASSQSSSSNLATMLMKKANDSSTVFLDSTSEQKKEMYPFQHDATEQLEATTDYRYIGNNPNNYLTFNNELWRIIGVFTVEDEYGEKAQRVKIVRNESIEQLPYDDKGAETGNYHTNWYDSSIMKILNKGYDDTFLSGSLYWNKQSGTCPSGAGRPYTKACDFTKSGLSENAKNFIAETKWYLGIIGENNMTIEQSYQRERSTNVPSGYKTNWIGSVALMYPSDIAYSYGSCYWDAAKSMSCYDTLEDVGECALVETNDPSCNSWFTIPPGKENIAVLLNAPYQGYPAVFYFMDVPQIGMITDSSTDIDTYPTLYLKSSVQFLEGDGSSSQPYQISN